MNKEGRRGQDGPGEEVDRWASCVIEACKAVHEALCMELEERGIPFQRQGPCLALYRGRKVDEGVMDLIVAGCLIVELKTVEQLGRVHAAQAISYLRATGLRLALLVNFNVPFLMSGVKRVVL